MADRPSITSGDAQVQLEQAYLYEEQGQYEEALLQCDAAIRLDANLPEAHNLRGIVLEALGRKKEAIEAYHEALRLDPRFSLATKNLADLEAELLLSLVGRERAKRIRLLRAFGLAFRILAWAFLSLQVLRLLASVYYVIRQGQYYPGESALLALLPGLLDVAINGAVYFAILFALSVLCVEIAEIARSSTRS